MNPNTSDLEVLPPHFTTGMDNPFIKEAILISYPNITKLPGLQNIKGLLLRCLASVVHHSHNLIKIINKHPGHPFSQISILNNPGLLNHLKPLVTILPSSKINGPTGIPPHVKMMTQLSDMLKLVNEERIHRKELEEKMTKTVENAIEKHALTNGHLTHQSVKNILHQHQQEVNQSLSQTTTEINDKMDHLINAMKGNGMNRIENEMRNNNLNENNIIPQNNIMRNLHQWDGKFWHVPKCFQFPKDVRSG